MNSDNLELKYIEYNLEPVVKAYYGYDILSHFCDILNKYSYDKVFFISEDMIYNLHGVNFVKNLEKNNINHEVLLIKSTEEDKTIKNIDYICNYLIEHKISKDSIIISFGGGVVGNITGLVAGLIYRGIQYIEIPTTFMGLTDSSLSHKQAVNGDSGKNQIGRYYAPLFIWSDIKYIETENPRNIKAAIVEQVKNIFIQDKDLLNEVSSFLEEKKSFDVEALLYLFETITQSKNRILARDPSEKKYSVVLEYGHTFGHAIEFLTKGKIIHGEAVAIGMCIAAEISYSLNKISNDDVNLHYKILGNLIFKNNQSIKLINKLTVDEIMLAIENDNKRTSRGIKYVILDEIGKCAHDDDLWQISVDKNLVMESIEKAFSRILLFDAEQIFKEALDKYNNRKLNTLDEVLAYYFDDAIDLSNFNGTYLDHIGIYAGDYKNEAFIDDFIIYLKQIESEGVRISNLAYGPTYISPQYYGTPGWWISFKLLETGEDIELFFCREYGDWKNYNKIKKEVLMSHYAIGVDSKTRFDTLFCFLKENTDFDVLILTEDKNLGPTYGHTYAHFKNKNTLDIIEIIYKK